MNPRPFRLAVAVLAAGLLCSCEKDDAKDTWDDVKDKIGLDDKDDGASLAGSWSGKSLEGGETTTLELSETGASVSGTATWPAVSESVAVSGVRSGRAVTLFVGDDTWSLTLKGNKLWGSAPSYNLSFVR